MEHTNSAKTAADHRLSVAWLGMVLIVAGVAVWKGPNNHLFWLWWEVGAILMATIYTMLFYFRLGSRKDESDLDLYEGLKRWVLLVGPFCFIAVLCLFVAMITSLDWWGWADWFSFHFGGVSKPLLPLFFLLSSGISFCLIDSVFGWKHTSKAIKHEFKQALLFNGLPVTIAFAFLLVFVSRFDVKPDWEMSLRSFIGGAIAFEMLLSNTMFAILFWQPREI